MRVMFGFQPRPMMGASEGSSRSGPATSRTGLICKCFSSSRGGFAAVLGACSLRAP